MALLYQLDDVGFAVEGRTILQPLNCVFENGRIHGLVGPNGSGKTTLMKLLARQIRPTTGSLRCLGRRMDDWNEREFARTIAYLPQFTPAAGDLTVSELVGLGRFPWHGALGRVGPQDRQMVAAAMTQCNVAEFSDRLVDTLSGGERQRVWLAMMIAQNARCLLLDEPTSALDLAHQITMLKLVRDLVCGQQISAVLVLHDINLAARFCDDILALREGAVFACGAPREIMKADVVSAIYGTDMATIPHPTSGGVIAYIV